MTQLFTSLFTLILGIKLTFHHPPLTWLGTGLIFASLGLLCPFYQEKITQYIPTLKRNKITQILFQNPAKEIFAIVLIGILSILMLKRVFLGDRPISSDHTVHYAEAWQLKEWLFKQGRLWGWSQAWFAGYPFNYFYPFGAYLLVIGIYCLFLGKLTLDNAYAVAFGLTFFLSGYSIYFLGKRAVNRTVGLIAAILLMTDTGSSEAGGWVWMVGFGVWPINLSFTFALLAMSQFERVLTGQSRRELGLFGLFMGLALLCHPLQLIHFCLFIPLGWTAYLFMLNTPLKFKSTMRLTLASAIAVLIGGLWFIPFFSVLPYCHSSGLPWLPLNEMGARLLEANLFAGMWPFVSVLGLLGVLAFTFSKDLTRFLIGSISFLYLLLGSDTFTHRLLSNPFFDYLKSIEYQRFSMYVKIAWFLGAAYMLWKIFYSLLPSERIVIDDPSHSINPKNKILKRFAKLFLVGLLIIPVFNPFISEFIRKNVLRQVIYLSNRNNQQIRKQVAQWINDKKKKDSRFFRVALHHSLDIQHDYLDFKVLLDVPVYSFEYTSANFYKYKITSDDPTLLKTINVRYVLSLQPLPETFCTLAAQKDNLFIYEFKDWDPNPFSILEGDAFVELKKFSDEEIILSVAPGATGRLMLHVSPFPRWSATVNGKPIPISTTSLKEDPHSGFMTVDLKHGPGIYRFSFHRTWVEMTAFYLFLLGLLSVGLTLFSKPKVYSSRKTNLINSTQAINFTLTKKMKTS